MKYKFTGETKVFRGRTLNQIVCVTAFASIAVGDIGGWVEKEENLSQQGTAWVYPDAKIMGETKIHGGEFHGGWFHGGEFLGGVFRGGVFRGGVFHGGEFHGGEFLGGVFRGGWFALQIQGSKHFLNIPNETTIRIGCQEHTPDFWLENFASIGDEHGYSEQEIAEYKLYIELAATIIAKGH